MGGRRNSCCHTCLAFVLKFLNFLQSFLGVCIIVYSLLMLNQWNHRIPVDPSPLPPIAPPPLESHWDFGSRSGFVQMVSGVDSDKLPAPWFIYSFMVLGLMLCSVNCIGFLAAESIHGCCLCFIYEPFALAYIIATMFSSFMISLTTISPEFQYSLLKVILILLEASFVAFVALDHNWENDLPFDPTGELDILKNFIAKNLEICKWVGITILIIQAVSLLVAFVLRATISTRMDDEYDDNYVVESSREPLIQPDPGQTSYSSKWDNIWSSRIRDKYGLGSADSRRQV